MFFVSRYPALLMDFLNTEEKRQRRLVHLPMGRFGEAVELARAALFCKFRLPSMEKSSLLTPISVASDDSSYVTVSRWRDKSNRRLINCNVRELISLSTVVFRVHMSHQLASLHFNLLQASFRVRSTILEYLFFVELVLLSSNNM